MEEEITSLRITKKTKKRLAKFGNCGESYEDVIKRLMKICGEKK